MRWSRCARRSASPTCSSASSTPASPRSIAPAATAAPIRASTRCAIQARLEANQVDEALAVVTEARRDDPASQRLLGLEAETRLRRGERDKAFTLYQQSIDTDGSDVDTHIAFAGLLLEAKEFKRAETVLTAARARFPSETSIPFQLGAVFEEQARYEDAERAFRDALLIDPKHAPTSTIWATCWPSAAASSTRP